jgi:D-alanine-D-alanine ligase
LRIVGYRAKWAEESFEYRHTTRRFAKEKDDAHLLNRLREIALECWHVFDLRGWARVDFRVDADGRPWILEVNANPCLAPDAGFAAAVARAGMRSAEAMARILTDAHRTAMTDHR